MREEIRKLQERLHITTVFVTHDLFEAMAISNRLVVMRDGLIEQVGSTTARSKSASGRRTSSSRDSSGMSISWMAGSRD
jgi:iron(III) transport system ATP-binding protein